MMQHLASPFVNAACSGVRVSVPLSRNLFILNEVFETTQRIAATSRVEWWIGLLEQCVPTATRVTHWSVYY